MVQATRLWIDCEFNGFEGELISMALVDKSGRSWYRSLGCEFPSDWVAEHVMPIIGIPAQSRNSIQKDLHAFLSRYAAIHVIADWPEDIKHFCELLITGPGKRIDTPPLTMEVRRDLDAVSALPHNALADAIAIRGKHLELDALATARKDGP